jgi:hypothetical protein
MRGLTFTYPGCFTLPPSSTDAPPYADLSGLGNHGHPKSTVTGHPGTSAVFVLLAVSLRCAIAVCLAVAVLLQLVSHCFFKWRRHQRRFRPFRKRPEQLPQTDLSMQIAGLPPYVLFFLREVWCLLLRDPVSCHRRPSDWAAIFQPRICGFCKLIIGISAHCPASKVGRVGKSTLSRPRQT